MNTKPPKRFDHLWREAEAAYDGLGTHGRLIHAHAQEFRRDSYHLAAAILEMDEKHHNDFVAMVESEGKPVSKWMDQRFEIVEAMGETRERLYAAIKAGVTEREWAEQHTVMISRKRINTQKLLAKDDGNIPQPSAKPATAEERAEEFRDLYASMVSKYQGVRKQLQTTRQELGFTQKRMRKLERVVLRLKKDVQSFETDRPVTAPR